MRMRWLARVALVGTIAGMACGGPQPQPATVPVAPTLRVGIFPQAPPMAFYQNGRLAGLSIDLAEQLGRELRQTVRFVPLGWDDLIPALQDKRIDVIMSGMTITPSRSLQVAFADPNQFVRTAWYNRFRIKQGRDMPPTMRHLWSRPCLVIRGGRHVQFTRES